ncbi:MAG: transporter [Bacillales bacterium]|jgi:EmrB/QacA subfamily drug resistance transporter|nr:transporter [Bacillales bacterium]
METLHNKKKTAIMLSIMAALLFSSLNQTIVGTVLPKIISELGGINYFSWVFTIFMLTSSITGVLVGKLSDIYGRKPFILAGLIIFMTGSLLAGTSSTMIQLIIYRGVQGLGAGMIISTAFSSVADLYPPRERGKWQGLLGSVFGLSSILGPTIGGWIVDYSDWHWVFWIFIPFGVLAFFLIFFMMPSSQKKSSEKIDYLGSLFLAITLGSLLSLFSLGGKSFEWVSVYSLFLFILSIGALIIFVYIEGRAKSPVLPLCLFKTKEFTLANIINFTVGVAMFGSIMYTPFFIQGVQGASATSSGIIMMPMTLSLVAASAISGQVMSKTGKYKSLLILGLFFILLGVYFKSTLKPDSSVTLVVIYNIITGIGLGSVFPILLISVQNTASDKLTGVATSSVQMFRQIGGTIGVAIFGTLLTTRMENEMGSVVGKKLLLKKFNESDESALIVSKVSNPQILLNQEKLDAFISTIPPNIKPAIDELIVLSKLALSNSITYVFLICTLIVAISLVLVFFIKEIPLRTNMNIEGNDKC